MGVRADEGIGIEHAPRVEDGPCEVLEVDLVHDAIARGHDGEVLECLGTPLQEGEPANTPAISLHLARHGTQGPIPYLSAFRENSSLEFCASASADRATSAVTE